MTDNQTDIYLLPIKRNRPAADDRWIARFQMLLVWLSPQVIVYTFHPHGYTEDKKAKHDQAYAFLDSVPPGQEGIAIIDIHMPCSTDFS